VAGFGSFLGHIAAGAAQGLGQGIVEKAKLDREERLKELDHVRQMERDKSQMAFQRSERMETQVFTAGENAKTRAASQTKEGFTLGEGQTRFDPSGNVIAAGPPKSDAPTVQKLKLDDGSEMAVQWDQASRKWVPIDAPSGGADITPRTKLTESQSKLTLFQSLQTETQPVLLDLEAEWNPANLKDAAARSLPIIPENFLKSEKGQMYDAAATAWAEGALRIATGAAATPEEMERTKKAYFAQPGDTPATIAFKAQMREMYNRAIERGLGKSPDGALPKPSEFMKQFQERGKAGADGKRPRAVNPETGETVEFDGTKWVPAK
jgi:hypothetical protein